MKTTITLAAADRSAVREMLDDELDGLRELSAEVEAGYAPRHDREVVARRAAAIERLEHAVARASAGNSSRLRLAADDVAALRSTLDAQLGLDLDLHADLIAAERYEEVPAVIARIGLVERLAAELEAAHRRAPLAR